MDSAVPALHRAADYCCCLVLLRLEAQLHLRLRLFRWRHFPWRSIPNVCALEPLVQPRLTNVETAKPFVEVFSEFMEFLSEFREKKVATVVLNDLTVFSCLENMGIAIPNISGCLKRISMVT